MAPTSQAAQTPRMPTIAKADLIEGVAKGMAVLESFDAQRQRLNATLAAERAGITRAAARRHLLTLAHLGYLETDGRYFWLAPKVLRFSGSFLATSRLPRAVQPTLNRLAAQTGESFSVAVLDGHEVVIVGRSGHGLRSGSPAVAVAQAYGLHLGARLPAHATSTGRILLANLPAAHFRRWLSGRLVDGRLPRLTAHTLTDAAAFKRAVAQAGRGDFCVAHQEHELGVHALAVPVRDAQGRTVAALNVVSTGERLHDAAIDAEWLPLLFDAVVQLRELL